MSKPRPPFSPPQWRRHQRQPRPRRQPSLRFSPTAWAKLLFLRDRGPTEVGGFGIASAEDLLSVEDVVLVGQTCGTASVVFDDGAVAEFFDEQIDQGRRPEEFGRIWIHTHPGHSAVPSLIDRETFARVFGRCDWAVMAILAQGGDVYAELHWRHGGPANISLDIEIDFTRPFPAADPAAWAEEYDAHVRWEHEFLRGNRPSEHPDPLAADLTGSRGLPLYQHPSREDDSLADFCRHPLAWEMA